MKKITLFIFLFFFSTSIFAEEHPLSTIQGPGINLQTFDHAFAGSIKDFLVWGFLDESTHTSELIMRKGGQTLKTIFKRWPDERIYGEIIQVPTNGTETALVTLIEFVKINVANQEIIININGTEIAVKLTADTFSGGHFVNPTLTTTYKGEEISFTLNGEACYGMVSSYAMMIVGAYVH